MAFRGEQQRIAGADVAVAPGDCLKGRFVIETELGQGSGGVVFVARDRLLDRPVAIKIMSHAAQLQQVARERVGHLEPVLLHGPLMEVAPELAPEEPVSTKVPANAPQ